MNIKIQIKTPKGMAEKTEKRIKTFIIPVSLKAKLQTYMNKDNDTIYWEFTGSIKQCFKINKNVAMFDKIIRSVFENKQMKKYLPRIIGEEGEEQIKDMLLNHTTVNIIKEATAQELVEYNKTYWQKIKETFQKKEE